MEPSTEAISIRTARLNSQLLDNNGPHSSKRCITREVLLDAWTVLYDECNNDALKRSNKNIGHFVEKFRAINTELNKLRVNIYDFEIKKVIGRGHFGEVHVVREKQTGDVYALKTIKKCDSFNQQIACYEEERNIMALSQSPWLTSLQYAFQDSSQVYFIMEYHPGGDLFSLLERQGGKLSEQSSLFYLCEIIQALHVLHSMGYVHRDIKPDNILLDRCGHIKLADFGSSAKLNSKGIVSDKDVLSIGTPDYIAPEVLQSIEKSSVKKSSYGVACDYWSLGIVAYELVFGTTPFSGTTITATYNKIINYKRYLMFPNYIDFSENYKDFINGLLCDQNFRLRHTQIVAHMLFKDVDWIGLSEQVPPFVPTINADDDTINFVNVPPKKSTLSTENFKTTSQFSGKNLPFIGITFNRQINVESVVPNIDSKKNEEIIFEKMKQIDDLQKKLTNAVNSQYENDSRYQKYAQYEVTSQNLEKIRDKLEKDLSVSVAENSALRRTLEIERHERKHLETQALELIKSAKKKWEAAEKEQIQLLNEQIDKYTAQITELCTNNNELTNKLERYEMDFKEKLIELERLKTFQLEHKDSLSKARALSRQSIIGVEHRLECISSEAQSQINTLQHQLMCVNKDKMALQEEVESSKKREIDLESQYKVSDEEKRKLKHKLGLSQTDCKEMQLKIKRLEDNLKCMDKLQQELTELKNENHLKNKKSEQFEDILKEERNECNKLKLKLKELNEELHNSMAGQNTKFVEQSSHMNELEEKVKQLSEVNEDLKLKLLEANDMNSKNHLKVEGLEELFARLETGVNKLESGPDRDAVLQEQIFNLQDKLKELHEASALDKQKIRTINSNLWKKEKELSNCQLDLRINQRELKGAEEKIASLNDKIKELNDFIETQQKSHDALLKEKMSASDVLENVILNQKNIIANLKLSIQDYENKYESEIQNLQQMKLALKNMADQMDHLKNDLKQEKDTKNLFENQLNDVRRENIRLHFDRDMIKKSEHDVQLELENCRQAVENAQLNINVLRDACTLLENQLEEYEQLISFHETKEKKQNEQLTKLLIDYDKALSDNHEVNKTMNEEKSLRLLAHKKCVQLTEDIDLLKHECDSYKEQIREYRDLSTQLNHELALSEEKCVELDVKLKNTDRRLENSNHEQKLIVTESNNRLIQLHQIKQSNITLDHELQNLKDINITLNNKIMDLEVTLNEQTTHFKQRDLKLNATIKQQTKLIDFLQAKLEETKKKRTFSNKLFGTTKKENIAPPLAQNKDMKDFSKKSQIENHILKSKSLPNSNLIKNESKKDDVLISKSKLSYSQLKSSSSQDTKQSHHDKMDRYESQIFTKHDKCASCSVSLQMEISAAVCKECLIKINNRTTFHIPKESANQSNDDTFDVQGWVKIAKYNCFEWRKKYICIQNTNMHIYENEPLAGISPSEILEWCPLRGNNYEYNINIQDGEASGNSNPFTINMQTRKSACEEFQNQLLTFLNEEDKQKWLKVLNNICNRHSMLLSLMKNTILKFEDELNVTCLEEFLKGIYLFGSEKGLFVSKNGDDVTQIHGPNEIHKIGIFKNLNSIIMIIEDTEILIQTSFSRLENQICQSSLAKHNLNFKIVNINNCSGFKMFEFLISKERNIFCITTNTQLFIINYDTVENQFIPLRVLDTAEPCSCILFNNYYAIVAANKFYEIDLETFHAKEFLDSSDPNLNSVIDCHKIGSRSVSLMLVNVNPIEYLLCFSEFGIFVDECGSRIRKNVINWSHFPTKFAYIAPCLYVINSLGIELIQITKIPNDDTEQSLLNRFNFELPKIKYLGPSTKGIYLYVNKKIILMNASHIFENDYMSGIQCITNTDALTDIDTELSFNSSVLDNMSSEDGSMNDSYLNS